jgi:predicted small metal-binding protein
MMSFSCRDLGFECPFEVTGASEQEIMRQFIDHARPEHDMHVLSAEVIYKIQNTIQSKKSSR